MITILVRRYNYATLPFQDVGCGVLVSVIVVGYENALDADPFVNNVILVKALDQAEPFVILAPNIRISIIHLKSNHIGVS